MQMLPLSKRLNEYLDSNGIRKQFEKQLRLFTANPHHPSLNTELLEPRYLRIYSFRITKKYRVIFVYCGNNTIEIVDI